MTTKIVNLAMCPKPLPLSAEDKAVMQLAATLGSNLAVLSRNVDNMIRQMATLALAIGPEPHAFVPDPDKPAECEACGLTEKDVLHSMER